MNYEKLDLNNWSRHEHFKFYQNAVQPWFNICCTVDVSKLYSNCKKNELSFFHAYLYLTQLAINHSEPFKYRLIDEEVRIYQNISISIAVLAEDEMMRFCELSYTTPFSEFSQHAKVCEQKAKAKPFTANNDTDNTIRQDVIHMSVLPWFNFTSFSNARITNTLNSIPKVIYGQCHKQGEQMLMPISVEVHHGMMDGLHVGRFVSTLQEMFDNTNLLA